MSFEYEKNPQKIEQKSFEIIRQLSQLDNFNQQQQQVVMRVVHSLGMPQVASQVKFSERACTQGMGALAKNCNIICDVEMVKQGITKRMIEKEPMCFLNHSDTRVIAKTHGETRSMAAVQLWREHLAGSVIIIGNAPTALFRLLEILAATEVRPALVIAMPVGFVGAAESKQALWDTHKNLGLECITLLGREGGSAVSAASCNALLRCNRNEYY